MHFRFKIGSSLAIPLGRDKHAGASRQCNIIHIVPLDPAQRAGLAGHVPVRLQIVGNNIDTRMVAAGLRRELSRTL
jgi:hypothetical protein